jgi:multicomponent K+:H+ antiporter subunit D
MSLMPHLIVAPIILPLFTAALMMMLGEKHRPLKARINLMSSVLGLAIACYLMWWVQAQGQAGSIGVYLPGNWQVPFGIVLVVDRLSALMLVLTGILGVCALLFATARWDRAGASFHALFQIQLMGLYGAFLTADLFNLFVFFEVLLAASYGLMLHGSGRARVSAGLHYIAINLLASSLFLIGAAMIYGVTGTLNMADLALKIPLVPEADRGLLHAGAAILATAFLAKAGMWPLNFWLVPAYSAASAPVAALFAIMTKVGFYTILRLWTLLFSGQAGASAHFGGQWLIYGGLATIAVAAVCIIAAQRLERMASLSTLVSAGILLAAIGFGQSGLIAGALFYLVSSTLALSALFMLAELIERSRSANEIPLEEDADPLPPAVESLHPPKGINLDDEQKAVVGQVIPWTMAFLGLRVAGHWNAAAFRLHWQAEPDCCAVQSARAGSGHAGENECQRLGIPGVADSLGLGFVDRPGTGWNAAFLDPSRATITTATAQRVRADHGVAGLECGVGNARRTAAALYGRHCRHAR